MIGHRKGWLKFAIVVAILAVALPAFALTNVSLDGTTTIDSFVVNGCFLDITISNVDAATYLVEVYDDSPVVFSTSVVQGGPGVFVVSYPIVAPAGGAALGIGVVVFKNGVPAAVADEVPIPDDIAQGCRDALLSTGNCPFNVIIPHGSVVGELPLGGRAYWAPGKITPEVYINPGTYWVVDAFRDEEGHDWYELFISCQYLWVPAEWMGPTFDGPWNGESLPLASNIPADVQAQIDAVIEGAAG